MDTAVKQPMPSTRTREWNWRMDSPCEERRAHINKTSEDVKKAVGASVSTGGRGRYNCLRSRPSASTGSYQSPPGSRMIPPSCWASHRHTCDARMGATASPGRFDPYDPDTVSTHPLRKPRTFSYD